ncbi:acyl-CoA dehydrogenase family protein [Pseudonocardia xinjiangensis]|uniref:Indole oxygenase n=1 Tax=Pseudonocardia xinjiangensis TaxID=75289 RepID=A0ABX1RIF7_9PSEU|nr:acyl-CoA dehydrogenase family protein [Pseudonocardia xinjiangensis]NMH80147.1 indole oxygenase [Pseudonocardia xinjiangensis]
MEITHRERAALVEAARAIAPVLRDNADQAERESRLTDEAADALREAGFFRLGVPRSHGGAEADLLTCLEVTSEVARACASSAWVVALSYGAQRMAGSFGEQVRADLWGKDPDVALCGAFTGFGLVVTRTDGGQLVSGRWSAVSGCYQAGWAALGMPIVNDDNERGLGLVPLDALSIEDTWDMAGMRGTGSNTLVADEVFVADRHIRRFIDLMEGGGEGTEPFYRVPGRSLAMPLAAVLHGIARSAFEQTMDVVDSGKPLAMSTYSRLADSPGVQASLAEAANLIDSAWLHMARSAEALSEAAEAGRRPDITLRARGRMDAGHASRCLREALQLLLTVSGASSFSRAKVIERNWRDLETAARHPSLNEGLIREMYGRALAGVQEQASAMI